MRKPTLYDRDTSSPFLCERQPGVIIDGKFATQEQLVEFRIPVFTSKELKKGLWHKYWRRRRALMEKKGWVSK